MGSIANMLLRMLLGWLEGATSWVWRLFSGQETGQMAWLMNNWLLCAVALCALGAAVDFVVYLFRWQPWRVWRRVWIHLTRKEKEEAPVRRLLYADGRTEVERPAQEVSPADSVSNEERLGVKRVIPQRRKPFAPNEDPYKAPKFAVYSDPRTPGGRQK